MGKYIEAIILVTRKNDKKVKEILLIEQDSRSSNDELIHKRFKNRIDVAEYEILEFKEVKILGY
jgi:hypothetical protein